MDRTEKILLVDDDPDILDILKYNLSKEGYQLDIAKNGKQAIEKAKDFLPDLILLDVMMPEMDGVEVCREIREMSELKDVLIAFLTARGEDYSQIAGFEAGADDYISKPIKPRVLTSRIKGLLRRKEKEAELSIREVGGLQIDREKYIVINGENELVLPRKEFELLDLLASKPGKVFTREKIMSRVWGNEVVVGDRTIDVHIRKLREKLGDKKIETVKGVGYKFRSD